VAGQIVQREVSLAMFSAGIRRFILGLAKKVLLANTLAGPADEIFKAAPGQLSTGAAWFGLACYTMQIYFDFSGYSDMALGLGKLFGFSFSENFNYPYIATSIQDFWRRWHISLSTWFRDYLYIPLGGNRGSNARTHFNLLTVFFLCGLWHGASWTFLLWGVYHGFFLILERHIGAQRLRAGWRPVRHLYALLVIMIGWVFFREDSLERALPFLGLMAGLRPSDPAFLTVDSFSTLDLLTAFFAGLIACTPFVARSWRVFHHRLAERFPATQWLCEAGEITAFVALLAVCACYLAAGTYNPFIYYRF
jgi:alginate O-acetyltransferase complex protein AlgI